MVGLVFCFVVFEAREIIDSNPFRHSNGGRGNVGPGRAEKNCTPGTPPGTRGTLTIRANCWKHPRTAVESPRLEMFISQRSVKFPSLFLRPGNTETVELFVWRFFSEVDEPLSFQECLKMPRNFMAHFTALDSLPGHCWPSSQASSGSQLPHSSNHFFAGVCF